MFSHVYTNKLNKLRIESLPQKIFFLNAISEMTKMSISSMKIPKSFRYTNLSRISGNLYRTMAAGAVTEDGAVTKLPKKVIPKKISALAQHGRHLYPCCSKQKRHQHRRGQILSGDFR